MTCDKCGLELAIGMYPFCQGTPDGHMGPTFHAQQDSIPGGMVIENAWREPRTFYSQSEYEKALDADGLMLNPHYVPGGKLANWAACMDPQTLENGRILAERQARTKASDTISVPLETIKWNTRVLEGTFTVKAEQ